MRRLIRCVPEEYGPYRYWLEVGLAESGPRLSVILKNPSRASTERSDPTVGKVEAWARRAGFGSIVYVNLFALRSTQPAALNDYGYAHIVGPDNDEHIRQAARRADTLVAAWGNANGIEPTRYDRRITEVLALVVTESLPLQIVGELTRQGYPRHGLLWNNRPPISKFEYRLKDTDYDTTYFKQ